MATPAILTPMGHALPPNAYHAITCHFPKWEDAVDFAKADPRIFGAIKSMYPRMILHRDVQKLTQLVGKQFAKEGQSCLLFTAAEPAADCQEFLTSPARGDKVTAADQINIKTISIGPLNVVAVFFPADKQMVAMGGFWMNAGVGISSRFAEAVLKGPVDEMSESSTEFNGAAVIGSGYTAVRERIISLLERSPVGPPRKAKVSPDDVFLFQTGMSGIYYLHKFISSIRTGSTVLFGFAFHSTIHVFDFWASSFKFLGLGTTEQLDELEAFLESEAKENRRVQAVWCEFPSNPLLFTPDLPRLRKLADKYEFILVIDDTIGSFANIDVLGAADVVTTSLTKSFSGYADVLGSSVVLNPNSPRYNELKPLFQRVYRNDLYEGDADVLEHNSRDFLVRQAKLDHNAASLVSFLQTKAGDPSSCVKEVYYTSTNWSASNYTAYMRPATAEYTPGYGCLFSIDFETVEDTVRFYDALHIHKGPHLGAHLSIAIPYARLIYAPERGTAPGYVEKYGMRYSMVRISVGLEDTETLIGAFREAVEKADEGREKKDA